MIKPSLGFYWPPDIRDAPIQILAIRHPKPFYVKLHKFLLECGYEGDLDEIISWIISFRVYPLFLFSFLAETTIEFFDFFDPSISIAFFLSLTLIQFVFIMLFKTYPFLFHYSLFLEFFGFIFFFSDSPSKIISFVSTKNAYFDIIIIDTFSFYLVGLVLFLFINIFIFMNLYKYTYPFLKLLLLYVSKLILILTFTVTNILHFYIFFETILLPFFFIVSVWGSRLNRIWSAQRLLFFTLFFSTPIFIFILSFFFNTNFQIFFNFFDFYYLFSYYESRSVFSILFFFSISLFFGVKVPLFPIHIWLPEAHGEAPTVGSILLAGVLLKLGAYGFYRFFYYIPGIHIFDDVFFFLYYLTLFSILVSTFSIFTQLDLKKIIAYFSIGHMAYVILGFITSTDISILGSFIITISHGLSSAALFFLVGFIYDQTHTRSLNFYSALSIKIPFFAFAFFFVSLANISFPGTAGFVGEQLIFFALSFYSPTFLIFPILFTIFNGFATILFLMRLLFGNTVEDKTSYSLTDLSRNDKFFTVFLIFPIFFFGVFPSFFI